MVWATTDDGRGGLTPTDLREAWPLLSLPERVEGILLLPRDQAEDFFFGLSPRDQAELVLTLPSPERRSWMRLLAPDDAADLLQEVDDDEREELFALLDDQTRTEVTALLAYAEDEAGGLMSPRYARVRPQMTVDEALSYLRVQARDAMREHLETLYYAYVVAPDQRLLGVVSFRELFAARGDATVEQVMRTDVVTVTEEMDQEAVSRLFAEHDLVAVPVIDALGRIVGIVTIDDIVDVVEEEATEDIHKLGGTEAFHEPYLQVGLGRMIRKRAGWLCILFVGELLTATAMLHYEQEIARAVVLALFVPLIISSGGNSGSQACTLVIRAMALGQVRLRDWWRVVRRELATGLVLGLILGTLGLARIALWPGAEASYGEHYRLLAAAVGLSLIGTVLFGTVAGSALPLLLRRVGLDPASASAPFIATLVDVSGVVIYFTVANLVLRGALL